MNSLDRSNWHLLTTEKTLHLLAQDPLGEFREVKKASNLEDPLSVYAIFAQIKKDFRTSPGLLGSAPVFHFQEDQFKSIYVANLLNAHQFGRIDLLDLCHEHCEDWLPEVVNSYQDEEKRLWALANLAAESDEQSQKTVQDPTQMLVPQLHPNPRVMHKMIQKLGKLPKSGHFENAQGIEEFWEDKRGHRPVQI